jgi:NTE family protein
VGTLRFVVNEGMIRRVIVEGNDFTQDYVIRREFPQHDGELFDIRKGLKGIVNINSTGLFEYALLDVRYEGDGPLVVLKVEEKSTNNVRIGFHADNERTLQALIDIRDVNVFGSGAELGFTFASSFRNRLSNIEYRATRIFNTLLTFNVRGYYRFDNIFVYTDDPLTTDTRWRRMIMGEYRQIKAGGTATFGAQLERWGNMTIELRMERQEIKFLDGTGYAPEQYKLVSLKAGTTIDTKNRFPFPTSGMMFSISYESANQGLGSDVAFGKLFATYEHYSTVFSNHTFRPKITVGLADATLPLAEHFSWGGLSREAGFFGLREDDTRGRQLFLVSAEYRFHFPFRLIFDTYLRLRYDFGQISSVPEELRLDKFRHGIGAELSLDTPIGPASFGAGHSFFLRRDLLNKPLSTGPVLWYFSIGYGI